MGDEEKIGVKIEHPKIIAKRRKDHSRIRRSREKLTETRKIKKRIEAKEPSQMSELVAIDGNMVLEENQGKKISGTEKRLREEKHLGKEKTRGYRNR